MYEDKTACIGWGDHEKFIIDNMEYLIDNTPTIETLRANYYNDNTLKSYLNVLVVRTSRLLLLRDNYQI